jgi:hypothetical protein
MRLAAAEFTGGLRPKSIGEPPCSATDKSTIR